MPDAYVTAALRRAVFARAKQRCEYCLTPDAYVPAPFVAEHIIPRAKGGKSRPNNLACSCPACNAHKYTTTAALDPLTGELAALFHPRRQRWADHFELAAGGLLIVGRTPTGRATIETLQLNHTTMLNLRRLLILDGLHPPNE